MLYLYAAFSLHAGGQLQSGRTEGQAVQGCKNSISTVRKSSIFPRFCGGMFWRSCGDGCTAIQGKINSEKVL